MRKENEGVGALVTYCALVTRRLPKNDIGVCKWGIDLYVMPVFQDAGVAQLVEHHLAKVAVDGPNPFARSSLY